jgi:hypothetical protein
MILPKRINLGSGKDFREDYLNIDINKKWNPDLYIDFGKEFPDNWTFNTNRFGRYTIDYGYFEKIVANDVLEHVPNLIQCMTNCLNLLAVGGTMEILVPYDLSYGAWQDPTHVRAFNERSWLYYTDWYWYIGWGRERFELTRLEYVTSPYGAELISRGVVLEDVARTPRAVDSMKVELTKIKI